MRLAIVSSKNEAIEEFIPNDLGLLASEENYKEYADIIEGMYNDENRFLECSKKCHEKVRQKCDFDSTIKKEIDLIKKDKNELKLKDIKLTNTKKIVKELMSIYNKNAEIIKFIDKENGGHGSTINVCIEKSTGKYVRIIGGDDWVNSKDLCKLIDILENENSDIVVTNYREDHAFYSNTTLVELYPFMSPGICYDFEVSSKIRF